jgi:hypothetical protein
MEQDINRDLRINNLYKCHTTACWAKQQLGILSEMEGERIDGKLPPLSHSFLATELKRISDGLFIDI